MPIRRIEFGHKLSLSIVAGCLLSSLFAHAGEGAGDDAQWRVVDALFSEWDAWDSPGAVLAVVRDGELVYTRGYGNAHLEYPIPITPSTVFHVASVSKQFTCFAIVLLAQEGKLSLDDDIRGHLPELHDFGQAITIRQLMHHTSGLRDQWELLALAGWRLDDVITQEHILKMLKRQRELNFEPGSEHLYCNAGYTLLAEIVARVSGQPFPEFAAERIFKPLGMSQTHFHDDHELIVPGRAYSYAPEGAGFRNSLLSFANVGATSLFTTAPDLARWLTNLDDGRVGGTPGVALLHERGTLNDGKRIDYALGLMHSQYRGLALVGHTGSDAGFRAYAVRVPQHKLGVVVLSNLSSCNPSRIAQQVIEVLLPEHLAPETEDKSESAEPVRVTRAVLDSYVGLYQLENGLTVKFTRRGDKLIRQLAGMPPSELVTRSETEFFQKERGVRVVFDTAEGKPAEGFTAYLEDQTLRGSRVKLDTAVTLSDFAGRYFSPELETTYEMVPTGDKLTATHQRHPDISLTPLSGEEFAGDTWFFGSVVFDRGEDGTITGFRVSGSRVRNLWFERQPEDPSSPSSIATEAR